MKTNMQEYLEAPLRLHNYKLECLQKRMALMPDGVTEYEKNEYILLKISTGGEIKALSNIIAERTGYLINYWNKSLLPDAEEMAANYDSLVIKAKKSDNSRVKELLNMLEFPTVGNVNVEAKIFYYKQLKNMIW